MNVFLLIGGTVGGADAAASSAAAAASPLARASAAVDGLFDYYYRGEPGGSAQFFFACGQIGGSAPPRLAPVPASQCVCEDERPWGCVNCYRWWSAVALEAVASYALAAGLLPSDARAARVLQAAEQTWQHAPYNAHWNATAHPTWVDDFAWYGLAYSRVYDWTGDPRWRQRALALLEWGWAYGWDATKSEGGGECGGFWWSLHEQQRFKDSISMVELLHLASRMAASSQSSAERASHLARAERTWSWLAGFSGGRGLLASNGVMSTGVQPEWCCRAEAAASSRTNGTTCANSLVPGESYNHGLLLSSAALLYQLTHEPNYLAHVRALLSSAVANLTNSHGALKDEQRGARSQKPICNATSGFDPGKSEPLLIQGDLHGALADPHLNPNPSS